MCIVPTKQVLRILGVSTERTICDLCGKPNLSKTIALQDDASGEVVYYGTNCAARSQHFGGKAATVKYRVRVVEAIQEMNNGQHTEKELYRHVWQTVGQVASVYKGFICVYDAETRSEIIRIPANLTEYGLY